MLYHVTTVIVQDMKRRQDLRHITVCSVDPPGCTDIDDALHCRELDNGHLEVCIVFVTLICNLFTHQI